MQLPQRSVAHKFWYSSALEKSQVHLLVLVGDVHRTMAGDTEWFPGQILGVKDQYSLNMFKHIWGTERHSVGLGSSESRPRCYAMSAVCSGYGGDSGPLQTLCCWICQSTKSITLREVWLSSRRFWEGGNCWYGSRYLGAVVLGPRGYSLLAQRCNSPLPSQVQ